MDSLILLIAMLHPAIKKDAVDRLKIVLYKLVKCSD